MGKQKTKKWDRGYGQKGGNGLTCHQQRPKFQPLNPVPQARNRIEDQVRGGIKVKIYDHPCPCLKTYQYGQPSGFVRCDGTEILRDNKNVSCATLLDHLLDKGFFYASGKNISNDKGITTHLFFTCDPKNDRIRPVPSALRNYLTSLVVREEIIYANPNDSEVRRDLVKLFPGQTAGQPIHRLVMTPKKWRLEPILQP